MWSCASVNRCYLAEAEFRLAAACDLNNAPEKGLSAITLASQFGAHVEFREQTRIRRELLKFINSPMLIANEAFYYLANARATDIFAGY